MELRLLVASLRDILSVRLVFVYKVYSLYISTSQLTWLLPVSIKLVRNVLP